MAKIILVNKAKIAIEEKYLEDFQSHVNLTNGTFLIVFYDNSLDERNELQGVCISSPLASKGYASDFTKILLLGPKLDTWDCCIAIANKWCLSREDYPAYFTYLLGHEFGHAHLCVSDINLHIYCCLIHNWIRHASNDAVKYPYYLPNEILFDQIGKYLSVKLHGNNKLNHEINLLKEKAEKIEKQHLEMIQELTPKLEIKGLRTSIMDFSKPYKNELIKCWKNDFEAYRDDSLVCLVPDYEKFWDKEKK